MPSSWVSSPRKDPIHVSYVSCIARQVLYQERQTHLQMLPEAQTWWNGHKVALYSKPQVSVLSSPHSTPVPSIQVTPSPPPHSHRLERKQFFPALSRF